MTILLGHPAARFAVADVANGYRSALVRAGHTVHDYYLHAHMAYHVAAIPERYRDDTDLISKHASETVVTRALEVNADLVVIVSGMNWHPIALQMLAKVGIPVAVILTESPYDDVQQDEWTRASIGLCDRRGRLAPVTVFTQERISADRYGWDFLPPAYDVDVHQPTAPDPEFACDVFFVGTAWLERQHLLEAVDWSGLSVKFYGTWPALTDASPIAPFVKKGCLKNERLPGAYAAAKISLNLYRDHPDAVTVNPRAVEIAACGGFQLSGWRIGVGEMFGSSVPMFRTAADLSALIREWLPDEVGRKRESARARACVAEETFDRRVETLMSRTSIAAFV
jgi:spore maturation protein CgeB